MLVLTRKLGERFVIGENIEVVVLSIQGNKVRLGFNAPESVAIHRHEIWARLQKPEPGAGHKEEAV